MSLTQSPRSADDDADVMSAIDHSGERTLYIISDVTRDDAWLTVLKSEGALLDEWR